MSRWSQRDRDNYRNRLTSLFWLAQAAAGCIKRRRTMNPIKEPPYTAAEEAEVKLP